MVEVEGAVVNCLFVEMVELHSGFSPAQKENMRSKRAQYMSQYTSHELPRKETKPKVEREYSV